MLSREGVRILNWCSLLPIAFGLLGFRASGFLCFCAFGFLDFWPLGAFEDNFMKQIHTEKAPATPLTPSLVLSGVR